MESDLKIPVSISIRKSLKKEVEAAGGNISGICSAALQMWLIKQNDREFFEKRANEAREAASPESKRGWSKVDRVS